MPDLEKTVRGLKLLQILLNGNQDEKLSKLENKIYQLEQALLAVSRNHHVDYRLLSEAPHLLEEIAKLSAANNTLKNKIELYIVSGNEFTASKKYDLSNPFIYADLLQNGFSEFIEELKTVIKQLLPQ